VASSKRAFEKRLNKSVRIVKYRVEKRCFWGKSVSGFVKNCGKNGNAMSDGCVIVGEKIG
jgi:hypothetical protein